MKRLFALLLCALLLLSLLPVSALAAKAEPTGLWEQITAIEDRATAVRGATTVETRAAAYSGIVDQVIAIVESSEGYVPGSLIRHGDFFYWDEADGTACGYSPRLRAQIREGADPNADPEAFSGTDTVCYGEKGGYPNSTTVSAFQPYIGIDTSFSAQYENRCNAIAQALGGTGTTYKTTNATIDNIAAALETSAVVIFDSHGDTDYANGYDYTSRANTSYICLQSGTGITSADQATVQGPYGSYKHAYYGGSYGQMQYYMVDGTAITNHMSGTSPNGLLWMAICLGMATDGLQAPIRARGVEVAYGYSQSVTFSGDYAWEAKFWQKMIAGENVMDSIAYMKEQIGCPDPYTGSYPAYPIVVSSEDPYPGHGNVDANQNVYSTWTLYTQHEVTAVANNPEWGSVSVSGRRITASPAVGYSVVGYEILEGDCTVTQDGNLFLVEAETDCTIQINFAPRVPASVSFSVPEGVSCEDFAGYVGDTLVMPMPEGTPVGDAHNYAFLGWTRSEIQDDVTERPEFVKAGTELTISEPSATYYALYTYFIAADGFSEGEFTLVESAPANWANDYVITYQGQKVLRANGQTTGTSIATDVSDLSEFGGVLSGNTLSNVPDAYIYTVEEADGSSYTIKMKEPDVWLALTNNSNSLTTAANTNGSETKWTFACGEDGVEVNSVKYANRYLRYNNKGNAFRCYEAGKQQPIALYAAAEGTKYYTTQPKEQTLCDEHSFGDWTVTVAPTCTEPGAEKRVCTVCGYTETREIAALGHELIQHEGQAATCTEAGWEAYETCARCDYSSYAEIPALGHDFGDWTVSVEPSCTEAGEKTRGCSRCDAVETETLEALGHDYGIPTWDWAEDCSAAFATFVCANCGDEVTLEGEIEVLYYGEDLTLYCAYVEFEGVLYSDNVEGDPVPGEVFVHTEELHDGDQIVIYNPIYKQALTDLVDANGYLKGRGNLRPENGELMVHETAVVWTVLAVDGGYEFVDASGNKLSVENGRNDLGLNGKETVWVPIIAEVGGEYYITSPKFVDGRGEPIGIGWRETKRAFTSDYLWNEGGAFSYSMEFFVKTEDQVHDCPCAAFEDMPEYGTPEHEAIDWAFTQGYTAGIDETHFGTGKSLTRAETATFFWTVSGKPEIDEADFENPFTDVKPGKWYTKYVLWAYSEGLVSGYEDGSFRPNSELNRGEILTLLYAWAGKPSVEGVENPYSDVKPGKWYEAPALWAYSEGIERGEDGLFSRNTLVTRETFVLYLYRHMTHNQLLGD